MEERTVDETGALVVSEAPTGSLGGAGFDFCAWLRRTGAKAKDADHPSKQRCEIVISINEF